MKLLRFLGKLAWKALEGVVFLLKASMAVLTAMLLLWAFGWLLVGVFGTPPYPVGTTAASFPELVTGFLLVVAVGFIAFWVEGAVKIARWLIRIWKES